MMIVCVALSVESRLCSKVKVVVVKRKMEKIVEKRKEKVKERERKSLYWSFPVGHSFRSSLYKVFHSGLSSNQTQFSFSQ